MPTIFTVVNLAGSDHEQGLRRLVGVEPATIIAGKAYWCPSDCENGRMLFCCRNRKQVRERLFVAITGCRENGRRLFVAFSTVGGKPVFSSDATSRGWLSSVIEFQMCLSKLTQA
ncbi:hypothetical protein QYF36_006141 [Acer negundo]|nr:hypothetical protein QYF36_006141 [Acer negundo]